MRFHPSRKDGQLEETIDYDRLRVRLAEFGNDREWKLIETLAVDLAEMILREFKPTCHGRDQEIHSSRKPATCPCAWRGRRDPEVPAF